MRRLLNDLAVHFDLEYRVRGVRLAELIERYDVDLDRGPLQDWGTPGSSAQVASVHPGPVYLYYVPHLFPGMDPKLRLVHQLQYHLLPKDVPEDAPVDLAAVLESFCHLSGDLFGWKRTADERFLIWIVDLSGHGLETGLACAVVRAIIDQLDDQLRIEEMVGELNQSMSQCIRTEGRMQFASGFFMKLAADGAARYCSAGHPPALVSGPGRELLALGANATPVGLFEDQQFVAEEFLFEPGQTLFLYTDGLPELTTFTGEEYGLQRLRDFLRRQQLEPRELTMALYDEIARDHDMKHLEDDVTFVAARMKGTDLF
jgi:sigma-B regulation protein RsbU (phosphoserine phosphatase)